jgi:hypothetical protein
MQIHSKTPRLVNALAAVLLVLLLGIGKALPAPTFCPLQYLNDLSGRYANWVEKLKSTVQTRTNSITAGARYSAVPDDAVLEFTIDTKMSMAAAEKATGGRLDNVVADRYPQALATDSSLADDVTDLTKAGEGLGHVNVHAESGQKAVDYLDRVEKIIAGGIVPAGSKFSDAKNLANMEILFSSPHLSNDDKRNFLKKIANQGDTPPLLSKSAGFVAEAQGVGALHRRGEPINGPLDPDWAPKIDFQTDVALYQNGLSSLTLKNKVDTPAKADAFVAEILAAEAHGNAGGRKVKFSRQDVDVAEDALFLLSINDAYKRIPGKTSDKWKVSDLEHLSWDQ